MDPFIFLFTLFLIILAVGILRSWQIDNVKELKYSILIACRNEENNLPNLFKALSNLNYPKDKFEIIIVDDASRDNSPNLINEFCSKTPNAQAFYLQNKSEEYLGKKAALKLAAENAKFDILLFTDADCFPQPQWIKSYNRYFSDKTGFVVGSYIEKNVGGIRKFGNKLSTGIYASTIGLGIPFSAAGTNMAVRRNVFQQVNGYETIKHNISGDDKLLLKLVSKTSWKIVYNSDEPVITKVSSSNAHQRNKRKYGKFTMSSLFFQILSIIVFIFYLYLAFRLFFFQDWLNVILYMIGASLFWLANIRKHNYGFKLIDLLYLIIYPYYLIYYSIIGITGKWEWKN